MSQPDISRLPRLFVSYSHDSPAHMDQVLALCDRLRHDGIDADLDQYESAAPEGWPRWTMRQIEQADYVLVICTETYRHRFDGTEVEGGGLGVRWEGAVLAQVLYNQGAVTSRLIPVVFSPEDVEHIPTILQGMTHYGLGDEAGYEHLYRRLTAQPAVPRPELGQLRALPPKVRTNAFAAARQQSLRPRRRLWLAATALFFPLLLIGYLAFGPPRRPGSPSPQPPKPAPAVRQLLRGEIREEKTGLPLAGVQVSLPELNLNAITGADGQYRFELPVPAGTQVQLRATKTGYKPLNRDPQAGAGLDAYNMRRNP
jgi:hypothetical protein